MKVILIFDGMFNTASLMNESFEGLRRSLVFRGIFCVSDVVIKNTNSMA